MVPLIKTQRNKNKDVLERPEIGKITIWARRKIILLEKATTVFLEFTIIIQYKLKPGFMQVQFIALAFKKKKEWDGSEVFEQGKERQYGKTNTVL